jgi:hypothetical protein
MLTKISGPDLDPSIFKNQGKFQEMEMDILTLFLPSSYYHTSPPSLSAKNFPPPSPAFTCILYIILRSERNFYPQVSSRRNLFFRHRARVFFRIPLSGKGVHIPFGKCTEASSYITCTLNKVQGI